MEYDFCWQMNKKSIILSLPWQWHGLMAEHSPWVDLCEVSLSFFHHWMTLLDLDHAWPYLVLYLAHYCTCSLSCHRVTYPKKPFKCRFYKSIPNKETCQNHQNEIYKPLTIGNSSRTYLPLPFVLKPQYHHKILNNVDIHLDVFLCLQDWWYWVT